jgi:two-component system, NtrC family, nitrogen regulation response regulator NtrX
VARRTSILLVDDDSNVRQSLEQALTQEDFHVVPAANGREAMLGFGEHLIDVALLDVHLGTESGWDTCRELRQIHPRLPVIMMTGHAGEVTAGPEHPVEAFLEKPLDLAQLIQKLGELVAENKLSKSARRAKKATSRLPNANS